jgi:hypothetical protein
MSKAKTGSKNNIATRGQAREFLFNGQKIKPVKLITQNSTFLAAEYETGELVLGSSGNPLPWSVARN